MARRRKIAGCFHAVTFVTSLQKAARAAKRRRLERTLRVAAFLLPRCRRWANVGRRRVRDIRAAEEVKREEERRAAEQRRLEEEARREEERRAAEQLRLEEEARREE